jgi:hypothetical protein
MYNFEVDTYVLRIGVYDTVMCSVTIDDVCIGEWIY